MATLPTPIRAALGLAATAIDEARRLPETLPQLPVTVIGTAMQASLRVQQHIAEYAARGDELLSTLRGGSDEPPPWATFDDQPPATGAAPAKAAFELVEDAEAVTGDDDLSTPSADAAEPAPAATEAPTAKPARTSAGRAKAAQVKPPATKSAPKSAPAKAAAKKSPAATGRAKPKDPARVKTSEPLEVAAERAEPGAPANPSVLAAEIVQAHRNESE